MPTKNKTENSKYIEAVGRRKTSVARVRFYKTGKSTFIINGKNLEDFFPLEELKFKAKEAILKANLSEKYEVSVKVGGGGAASQAEAIRLGTARIIIKIDPELRGELKKDKLLKRDPRSKERRKFGLKKARKAPQWSKR